MSLMPGRSRRPLVIGAAVLVLAAAMFGAGFGIAAATVGSDDAGPATVVPPGPGEGRPQPAIGLSQGGNSGVNVPGKGLDTLPAADAGRGSAGSTGSASLAFGYGPGCPADLSAIVSGGTFDLSRAGFSARLLSAGFVLSGLSVGASAPCDSTPRSTGDVSLSTSWLHTATGIVVNVTQTAAKDRVPNVLQQGYATFWADGYAYALNVNAFPIAYASDGSGAEPARPAIAPAPPGADPRAQAVLQEAVAQLAPGLGLQCFYTETLGGWDELSALGIGDPRPAVPSAYSVTQVNVRTFTGPAASGCDAGPAPDAQSSFDATFVDQEGGANEFRGAAFVNAYEVPKGQPAQQGHVDDYAASWSNGRWQFNVGFKSEKPVGRATVEAIAKALDPTFDPSCFVRSRDLTGGEVESAGFHAPVPPDGFKVTKSSLQVVETPSNCGNGPKTEPRYNLVWTLDDSAGTFIQAGEMRDSGVAPEKLNQFGMIGQNEIRWSNGTTLFYVSASSKGTSPVVSQEVLIAVAKSMDPTFDPGALGHEPDGTSGSGGAPAPQPAPKPLR